MQILPSRAHHSTLAHYVFGSRSTPMLSISAPIKLSKCFVTALCCAKSPALIVIYDDTWKKFLPRPIYTTAQHQQPAWNTKGTMEQLFLWLTEWQQRTSAPMRTKGLVLKFVAFKAKDLRRSFENCLNSKSEGYYSQYDKLIDKNFLKYIRSGNLKAS